MSKRVLEQPISLDMVEVGGSFPPGPTENKKTWLKARFFYSGLVMERPAKHDQYPEGVMCHTWLKIKSEFNSVSTWHSSY